MPGMSKNISVSYPKKPTGPNSNQHPNSLSCLSREKNVILATPTTLISLLKTVAFGWQQEKLTENARKISELGTELFERLSTMGQHINNLGRDIERSAHTYNKVVGSLERRVLISARKFKDLGITQKDQNKTLTVTPIDSTTRTLRMDDS